jgi:hypothetical protein
MLDLHSSDLKAIDEFGRTLMSTYRSTLNSFEEAAIVCVKAIYDEFRQPNGQHTFALVRIYRLCRFDELLPELQAIATPDVPYWMALMGTVGNEPTWCDRRTSQGHKAIRAVGDRSPMLTAAFEQIGLNKIITERAVDTNSLQMQETTLFTSYFHVPHALGSPFIPAQHEFVEPYHIQSVVGVGSAFLSNSIHLTLCFADTFLDEDSARKFSELSTYISTLLAIYDGNGVIWAQ